LIHAKYLRGRGFFTSSGRGGSQFWKGLHKVKQLFKWGAIHKVGRGDQTRRELSDTQIEMWRELNSKLLEVVLVDVDDVVRWAF
jgi:hypothetical protein